MEFRGDWIDGYLNCWVLKKMPIDVNELESDIDIRLTEKEDNTQRILSRTPFPFPLLPLLLY